MLFDDCAGEGGAVFLQESTVIVAGGVFSSNECVSGLADAGCTGSV